MNKIKILTVFLLAATSLSVAWAATPEAKVAKPEAIAPSTEAGGNLQGENVDNPPPPPPPPPMPDQAENQAYDLAGDVDARVKNIFKAAGAVKDAHKSFSDIKKLYAKEPSKENKGLLLNAATALGNAIASLRRNSLSIEQEIDRIAKDADLAVQSEVDHTKEIKRSIPKNQNPADLMLELQNRLQKKQKN